MTLPPQLIKGFLAEAQSYVNALRRFYEEYVATDDVIVLQSMQQQMDILGQAAEMLELETLASLANPASTMLTSCIEDGGSLDDTYREELTSVLDRIEEQIKQIEEDESEPERDTLAVTSLWPDLPPELRDIFSMEATDHYQNIQKGLETLRRNPGDRDALSEVRRVTHTLKGAAASVGFEQITDIAHAMEDITEAYLDRDGSLATEDVVLLLDAADTIEALLFPADGQDVLGQLVSLEERLSTSRENNPGNSRIDRERYDPVLASSPTEPTPAPVPTENLLRLPLPAIDSLINQVGEIIINRSISERRVDELIDLLSDLNTSTRRLRRVAREIESQIHINPQLGVGRDDVGFDPLELDRYTRLHEIVRQLEEAAHDTNDINSQLHIVADEFSATLNRERRLTSELQEDLLSIRLVPFAELETRLVRVVQRTARAVGKPVELVLEGLSTEVDKTILNALVDPLTHLLRNAIDHGIEGAAERQKASKPETGTITLKINRERGRIILSLSDDGAGIDLPRLEEAARRQGLFGAEEVASTERLTNLLFIEGFSLASQITETSGRGLGLNIVRRAIENLQGILNVRSEPGMGTTFTISLPVTLAITRALYVTMGRYTFAVPLDHISSVLRLEGDQLAEIAKHQLLSHQGRSLSVFDLATYTRTLRDETLTVRPGLVIESGEMETVLLVDGIVGSGEAVIKSLGTHLRRVHGVAGATISGDGSVILILDALEIIAGEHTQASHTLAAPPAVTSRATFDSTSLHVLVVDDSISVRQTVCSVLERNGWQATPARDGLDALQILEKVMPDVVLVDIEMPRMNGFELLSHIKNDPALKHLPVVILTSRSAAKHRDRAHELGVDGYLVKPYREDVLLEELLRVRGERVG